MLRNIFFKQLRNAIKYNVLFVIAYFNIPENIISELALSSELFSTI